MQYHKIRDKELWNINDVGRCALCCQPVDHDDKRIILVQGGEGSAEIVRLQHRALHRFLRQRRKCHTFAARPIPSPSRPADICSASTGRTYDRSRPNRSKRQNSACHGGPSTYEVMHLLLKLCQAIQSIPGDPTAPLGVETPTLIAWPSFQVGVTPAGELALRVRPESTAANGT